jgi:hypothetical protein
MVGPAPTLRPVARSAGAMRRAAPSTTPPTQRPLSPLQANIVRGTRIALKVSIALMGPSLLVAPNAGAIAERMTGRIQAAGSISGAVRGIVDDLVAEAEDFVDSAKALLGIGEEPATKTELAEGASGKKSGASHKRDVGNVVVTGGLNTLGDLHAGPRTYIADAPLVAAKKDPALSVHLMQWGGDGPATGDAVAMKSGSSGKGAVVLPFDSGNTGAGSAGGAVADGHHGAASAGAHGGARVARGVPHGVAMPMRGGVGTAAASGAMAFHHHTADGEGAPRGVGASTVTYAPSLDFGRFDHGDIIGLAFARTGGDASSTAEAGTPPLQVADGRADPSPYFPQSSRHAATMDATGPRTDLMGGPGALEIDGRGHTGARGESAHAMASPAMSVSGGANGTVDAGRERFYDRVVATSQGGTDHDGGQHPGGEAPFEQPEDGEPQNTASTFV